MTRRVFDLAVIGDDAAGLAAAACAARAGASVVVVASAAAKPSPLLDPATPDAVWRKLALHDSFYKPVPYTSRVSLFSDGGIVESFADSERLPGGCDLGADAQLWPEFWAAMDRRRVQRDDAARRFATGDGPGPMALLAAGDIEAVDAISGGSAVSLLDDFFETERLKTHLAAMALTPFSLGGDEPGSAFAIEALSARSAWPYAPSGKRGLRAALDAASEAAGVERLAGEIVRIDGAAEKVRTLILADGEGVRARHVLSSPAAGEAGELMRCSIRIRFAEPPPAPAGRPDALFHLADSAPSFADARDMSLTGVIPEDAPLVFAVRDDCIYATAPYCPARLASDDDATREWSEQDRQAFGRQITARLAPYLEGAARHVRRVDLSLAHVRRAKPAWRGAVSPPPAHDVIGAAVSTALDLVDG